MDYNMGCFNCGKPSEFQTWQYWDIEKGRHMIAEWCSDECLEEAKRKVDKSKFNSVSKKSPSKLKIWWGMNWTHTLNTP